MLDSRGTSLDQDGADNDEHRTVIETIRGQLWELYKALKTYKLNPDPARKPILEARFDTLVDQRDRLSRTSTQVLKSMREMKADLLRVLAHPEIPLHNNAEESDIREFVKRRKISGGTRTLRVGVAETPSPA